MKPRRIRREARVHRRHVRSGHLLRREQQQVEPVRVRNKRWRRLPPPQGPELLRVPQANYILQGHPRFELIKFYFN